MPYPVPLWLQLAIGVFDILMPALKWLNPVIIALYELYMALPFLHRFGFIYELRQAVKIAKALKMSADPDPTKPLKDMHAKWAANLGMPGMASDLVRE